MRRQQHFDLSTRDDAKRVAVIVCVSVALGIACVAAGILRALLAATV